MKRQSRTLKRPAHLFVVDPRPAGTSHQQRARRMLFVGAVTTQLEMHQRSGRWPRTLRVTDAFGARAAPKRGRFYARPPNLAFNRTSRRILPAAEAARSNSTGAASRCLQVATRCMQLIGGKRHAAPVAASLKSGSQLNVGRCADGITSCVGRGAYSRDASLKQLPLCSPAKMIPDPCC